MINMTYIGHMSDSVLTPLSPLEQFHLVMQELSRFTNIPILGGLELNSYKAIVQQLDQVFASQATIFAREDPATLTNIGAVKSFFNQPVEDILEGKGLEEKLSFFHAYAWNAAEALMQNARRMMEHVISHSDKEFLQDMLRNMVERIVGPIYFSHDSHNLVINASQTSTKFDEFLIEYAETQFRLNSDTGKLRPTLDDVFNGRAFEAIFIVLHPPYELREIDRLRGIEVGDVYVKNFHYAIPKSLYAPNAEFDRELSPEGIVIRPKFGNPERKIKVIDSCEVNEENVSSESTLRQVICLEPVNRNRARAVLESSDVKFDKMRTLFDDFIVASWVALKHDFGR